MYCCPTFHNLLLLRLNAAWAAGDTCVIVVRENAMKIEVIEWNDVDTIKSLWEGLNAHHLLMSNNFKRFYTDFKFERRIESLGKKERLITFIAQDMGKNIGYCIASVNDLAGEIDSIFIQDQYRRTGIGTKLITSAIKWLEKQKCDTIRVGIADGNKAAIGFYKRFGFAERMVVMQKIP